ncbi:hypothetical protein LCGC14_2334200 [marine sediment metagenome]|uniref:Uncharacterized protein n=1 Tax=marine sediment metagenome TaxID=412755 RepID=A0A0F9F8X3_9ZZZZ
MTDKCNTINPSGNDVILNLSTRNMKAELKELIRRWKKEAGLYRSKAYKDKTKCRCLDLTLEMCAESIEALLCVRAS